MRATRQLTPAQSVAWGKFVSLQLHSRTHSYAPGGSWSHGRCSRLQWRKSAANTFTDREIYNAQFFYLFIFFSRVSSIPICDTDELRTRTNSSWAQKVTGHDLGLETSGLGLEHLWPWPRRPVALALTLASIVLSSNTSLVHTHL